MYLQHLKDRIIHLEKVVKPRFFLFLLQVLITINVAPAKDTLLRDQK